jgi:hypothetical protein
MSNMGYIRFENTLEDLEDCFENWEGEKSESEEVFRKRLLELCIKIVSWYDYGDEEE